jgi:thiamine pyrophosphokinase
MRAIILAGGDQPDPRALSAAWPGWERADLVIGADGGARAAAPLALPLHQIIGDFDTLTASEVEEFAARGVRVERLPHEKDATDTEIALLTALDAGATEIVILGALGSSGGRSDHALGTISLLAHPRARGVKLSLLDVTSRIQLLVAPARCSISARPGAIVSLVPWGADARVTTEGLRWPLRNELLTSGSTRGLSNESLGDLTIELHEGALLVSEGA